MTVTNGKRDSNLSQDEIASLIRKHSSGRPFTEEEARDLTYRTKWSDIIEAMKIADSTLAFQYMDVPDPQLILSYLPLETESFQELGVSYETHHQSEPGSNLKIKKKAFELNNELLVDSVEAYLTFNDFDVMRASNPHANEDEKKVLRTLMKDFSEAVISALSKGVRINTFVTKVDETTKASIANAFMLGLYPLAYPNITPRSVKANLFIGGSLNKNHREKFYADLNYYIKLLCEKGESKQNVMKSLGEESRVDMRRLEGFMEYSGKPTLYEIEAVEKYFMKFIEGVKLLPRHRLDRTAFIFSRKLWKEDIEKGRIIEGVPEINYDKAQVTVTNFLPLTANVYSEYKSRSKETPAWHSEWMEPPKHYQDFISHLDDIIESASRGVIYRSELVE